MSPELTELAAAALRGTARSSLPEPGLTPLGQALALVTAPTPESTLLLRAGLAGLHALAGKPPAVAGAEIHPPLPPDANPVPEALSKLLPQVADSLELLTELIGFVAAAGQTLGPQDLWALRASSMPVDLWTVLGERARWLARQHPDWRGLDPAQYSKDVRVQILRAEVLEAHVTDPERVAADLLTRWPDFKPGERRAVLEALAASLHTADLPLLEKAATDRLPDVQRRAKQLRGHLPGEVQDALRVALRASVGATRGGKFKFVPVDLPDVLGIADPVGIHDVTTSRYVMFGALPMPVITETLGLSAGQLLEAADQEPTYTLTGELVRAMYGVCDLALARTGFRLIDFSYWPQSRIRRLAVEAAMAVSPGAPDTKLLKLLTSLLAALDEPLELPQAEQTRLHELTAALLTHLVAKAGPEADSDDKLVDASLDLLEQLPYHLDPHRALPEMPDLPGQEPLPDKPKKDEEQRYYRRSYYLTRLERLQKRVNWVLTVRRRVAEALGRAP